MTNLLLISVLIGVICSSSPIVSASIRLPTTTYPINYRLNLNIDVDAASYSGSVAIRLNVTNENVNLIALNYHEQVAVSDVLIYLASDSTQSNLLSRINAQPTTQIIEFTTNSTLVPYSEYVLRMAFDGAIRSDLKGLYMSSYWINGTRRNLATTFFAPHYARMVFPCYDEPRFKASFDVQITNDIKYHALANAVPNSYAQTTENITTFFRQTPKMSTYLLAFIVSDLVASPDAGNNSIAVWSQESKRNATAFSLSYVHQVRTALEDYLGLPYQMSKLDLVAVDDFLMGAMENWGLITFASGRLLADEASTTAERQSIVQIVSHEVTHQWFGNLVTCHWWNDIWLNEGFATYVEDVIADKVANQWLVLDQFVVSEKIPAMRKDSDRTHRKAMSQDVTTLAGISAIYDFVAYPKAGSVLRMFHHVVGDRIFQQTLQEYLKTHQYANVERKDFFSVLERVASELNWTNAQGVSLSEAFENWAENYGFPLVTVARNYAQQTLNISQARFIHSNFNSHTPDVDFFVPLKFATSTNQSIDEALGLRWLTPQASYLELFLAGDSWVLLNPNAFGYYRVNYDEENWKKLSTALHTTNSIPSSSRVQLIDDVMTLARFGRVSYSVALNLIRYIKQETSYTPIVVALGQLDELETNVRGLEINITGLNYDILDSLYRVRGQAHLDRLLEAEVRSFACKHAYDKCVSDSHALFDAYLQSGTVDPDLRGSMFCGAVQSNGTGDQEQGRFSEVFSLWARLAKSEYDRVINERHVVDILDAFGCLRTEDNIQEMLTYSLRNDVGVFMTSSDRLRIFTAIVSGSLQGTGLALERVQNNWNVAIERYGSAAAIYSALGPNVVLPAHVRIFDEIVFTNMRSKALETIEPATYEAAMAAVRQVEENVQFITNHRDQLMGWFEENYPDSSGAFPSSRNFSLLLIGVSVLLCLLY